MWTVQFRSLNEDVSNGLDEFVPTISSELSHVPTRVGVVWISSSTKPDSGVAGDAIIFIVAHNAYPCLGWTGIVTQNIETFSFAVLLQGGLKTDQFLPFVATQIGGTVFTILNQGVERASLLVQKIESVFYPNLYPKADLGKGCGPVG